MKNDGDAKIDAQKDGEMPFFSFNSDVPLEEQRNMW